MTNPILSRFQSFCRLAVIGLGLSPALAFAQAASQTVELGEFNTWRALLNGKDKSRICYALNEPKERKPEGLKRDPAYLFISHRMSDGTKNEIAIEIGFPAKAGASGTLEIGRSKFDLMTDAKSGSQGGGSANSSAFLVNPAQEAQVVELMKKTAELTVRTLSVRGNETIDRYDLTGFTRAYERMSRECP